MQIELTPAQLSFVDHAIQEGRIRTSEDAVREAMALWENRERVRVQLLNSLDLAEQSMDAGDAEEFTAATLPSLVRSIEERGIENLARR